MFICVYMLLLFLPNTQKQHLTLILNSQKSEKKDLPTLCLLLLSAEIFHCRPLFCCFSIMLSSRIFLTPKMKFMQSHRIDFVIDLLDLSLLYCFLLFLVCTNFFMSNFRCISTYEIELFTEKRSNQMHQRYSKGIEAQHELRTFIAPY